MTQLAAPQLGNTLTIVRRGQSAQSRQHRGVLTQVIFERSALEILRTEMEAGSAVDSQVFGDFSAVHYVVEGTPVFRSTTGSADLVPGDSVVFGNQRPYTIVNCAPSRLLILSVLFKTLNKEIAA